MSDTIFLTFVSVRGICVKWFPTTDELTHLFTFPTSLTARDERIIMQHTKIFCFMLVLSTIDANNFFYPSPQSYLHFLYSRRIDDKNFTLFYVSRKLGTLSNKLQMFGNKELFSIILGFFSSYQKTVVCLISLFIKYFFASQIMPLLYQKVNK